VPKKFIEYLSARSMLKVRRKFVQTAVPWKLVGEAERAGHNLRFDPREVGTRALEIRLAWDPGQRGAETVPVNAEVKANPAESCRLHRR
jgi:hypothetical protein